MHHPSTVTAFHLSLCRILFQFLCVSLPYCHSCHSNLGIFNWDANKQQQSSEALGEGSQHLLGLQGEICKELQGGCQARRSWESHCGKGGTRKGGEKERACHLSLQDSCKVLITCVFIHSSPLFSNHLLRDISKKGRRGRD